MIIKLLNLICVYNFKFSVLIIVFLSSDSIPIFPASIDMSMQVDQIPESISVGKRKKSSELSSSSQLESFISRVADLSVENKLRRQESSIHIPIVDAHYLEQEVLNKELLNAIEKNDIEAVDKLIGSGADVDTVNMFGQTALMIAAEKGYARIVELLIHNDAMIDAINPIDGRTALMYTVPQARIEVARMLIRAGALLELHNKNNKTVIDLAQKRLQEAQERCVKRVPLSGGAMPFRRFSDEQYLESDRRAHALLSLFQYPEQAQEKKPVVFFS
jgi:hypothetical protein